MFANSSKPKDEGSGDEDGDDENVGNGSGSPPSFMPEKNGFSDATAKPLKLNIESKPPEMSPYDKVFYVRIYTDGNAIRNKSRSLRL